MRFAVVRLLLFGALGTCLALGSAAGVEASGTAATRLLEDGVAAPRWSPTDAAAHPECVALADWPTGAAAPYVVVEQVRDGRRLKMTFDRAWRQNHDPVTEVDDVWVLGVCG